MAKSAKKPDKKKKVVLKDLKAKGAKKVRGGGSSVAGQFDISKRH